MKYSTKKIRNKPSAALCWTVTGRNKAGCACIYGRYIWSFIPYSWPVWARPAVVLYALAARYKHLERSGRCAVRIKVLAALGQLAVLGVAGAPEDPFAVVRLTDCHATPTANRYPERRYAFRALGNCQLSGYTWQTAPARCSRQARSRACARIVASLVLMNSS